MSHHAADSEYDFFTSNGRGHHREKVYPYDALGATIVAGNTVWGGSKVVIPDKAQRFTWLIEQVLAMMNIELYGVK